MNQTTPDAVSTVLDGFAKLVAAAPESNLPQDDPYGLVAPSVRKTGFNVREANGWGAKYVNERELTGDEWAAKFEDAKKAVESEGIVAFLGGRGCGKTQMAAEIARSGRWPDDAGEWNGNFTTYSKTALYRRAMDVFLDLRDAAQNNSGTSEKKVMAKMEKVGLLVIDEFQERGGSEWENRIVCNLIDKRYAANRPTILIANYTREEMAKALSDSVKDRIRENGKAIIFNWKSYRANQ